MKTGASGVASAVRGRANSKDDSSMPFSSDRRSSSWPKDIGCHSFRKPAGMPIVVLLIEMLLQLPRPPLA